MVKRDSRLISFLSRQLDGCLKPDVIKQFVLKKYSSIIQNEPSMELSTNILERIKDNLITLGWIEVNKGIHNQKHDQSKILQPGAVEWVKYLENGRVINQGIIAKGAGDYLDTLDECRPDLKDFTAEALESLLRYVEVKRKNALNAFSRNVSAENKVLEGLAITILFSRAARRHTDLRFLNAALKMNDWYFPRLKTAFGGKPLLHYLLALTEQEISAMELLQ